MNELRMTACLTPHGRLVLATADDAVELEAGLAQRLGKAFARGSGHGLLRLGAAEVGQILPPVFSYWREIGARYVTALCTTPDVEERRGAISPPSAEDLEALASAAPAMPGAEYLTGEVLGMLWGETDEAFTAELAESGATVQDFLKRLHPALSKTGPAASKVLADDGLSELFGLDISTPEPAPDTAHGDTGEKAPRRRRVAKAPLKAKEAAATARRGGARSSGSRRKTPKARAKPAAKKRDPAKR